MLFVIHQSSLVWHNRLSRLPRGPTVHWCRMKSCGSTGCIRQNLRYFVTLNFSAVSFQGTEYRTNSPEAPPTVIEVEQEAAHVLVINLASTVRLFLRNYLQPERNALWKITLVAGSLVSLHMDLRLREIKNRRLCILSRPTLRCSDWSEFVTTLRYNVLL